MLRSNQLSYITEGGNYSHKTVNAPTSGARALAVPPVKRYGGHEKAGLLGRHFHALTRCLPRDRRTLCSMVHHKSKQIQKKKFYPFNFFFYNNYVIVVILNLCFLLLIVL